METIEELYRKKGQLHTKIEILRSELIRVQNEICRRLNEKNRASRIIEKILNEGGENESI